MIVHKNGRRICAVKKGGSHPVENVLNYLLRRSEKRKSLEGVILEDVDSR